MHELGIMTGVIDSVEEAASNAGAQRVINVVLSVGVMTEAIEDALQFAFDALTANKPLFEGSELVINIIQPKSICLECGHEYNHDRFHMLCPECKSPFTQLLEGKELFIESIEVDLPDDDNQCGEERD